MSTDAPQFGGGYSPGLRRSSLDIDPSVDWLASEHYQVKRAGATFDYTTVTADADGRRIVKGGTALAKITATGKYAPYDDALTNGREVGIGFLFPGDINVQFGDIIIGVLLHGSVLEARCTGVDAAFKADVAGRISFQ
jgi:hypothetical protein